MQSSWKSCRALYESITYRQTPSFSAAGAQSLRNTQIPLWGANFTTYRYGCHTLRRHTNILLHSHEIITHIISVMNRIASVECIPLPEPECPQANPWGVFNCTNCCFLYLRMGPLYLSIFILGAGPLYGGRHVFYSSLNWKKLNTFWVFMTTVWKERMRWGVFSCNAQLHHYTLNTEHSKNDKLSQAPKLVQSCLLEQTESCFPMVIYCVKKMQQWLRTKSRWPTNLEVGALIPSSLFHVPVSLGKALNPKLSLKAIPSSFHCVWMSIVV